MKVTYNWLKEFVDFNNSPQELADLLTMAGFEVEIIVPVKPLFKNVIVGKILDIKKHPNADKLLVCEVTTGKEPLLIICGAHNIQKGDFVPVAVAGAELSNGLKISKRAIKNIESYGMLCSEQELGLTDYISGILILSKENTNGKTPKLGQPLEKLLPLEDTIFDVNITPNRPDALSISGIAREISALTKKPFKKQNIDFIQTGTPTNELVKISVRNKKLCPRYTARIIKGVKVKPSPFWLRYRLGLVGTRAVNNIVDITNYVLVEQGQPLHAFDFKRCSGNDITIRQSESGETIRAIDNSMKTLDNDMLIITDQKCPIAIAGVMGGSETEVSSDTTEILIESALFNPPNIRRTSKKLNTVSESSYRFERGVDPQLAPYASSRAAHLIQKTAGGDISKGLVDHKYNLPKVPAINFSISYCNKILGTNITSQKMYSILKSIGCKINKFSKNSAFRVMPPSYRIDLKQQVDIIEEIARLYGYNKIPFAMPEAEVLAYKSNNIQNLICNIKSFLAGIGLNEIITYSFIDPDNCVKLNLSDNTKGTINLINPVSVQTSVMRTSLAPGLINTISLNINQGTSSLSIFEIGKCYFPDAKNTLPVEKLYLGIGLTGDMNLDFRKNKSYKMDLYYLKGVINALLTHLSVKSYKISEGGLPLLHPGQACNITINSEIMGFFGKIHPAVLRNSGISQDVFIAELDINYLLNAAEAKKTFMPLPKYPGIRRDISIIVDKNTPSYDTISLIQGLGVTIIESVEIFDLYTGDPIPNDKKSLAYAINYRHKDRTLTDKEVEEVQNIVRRSIIKHLPGVQIRE